MKLKTFLIFVFPSVLTMFLFIAAPLGAVFWQSFHLTQAVYEEVEVETCTPGFLTQTCVVETKIRPLLSEHGEIVTETRYVGLDSYRNVLELERLGKLWDSNGWDGVMTIDFWKALRFTLMFTLITLPLVLGLGLLVALTVNSTLKKIRGPVIFISLLPFIITPVIGALSIRWLFIGDGILTAGLEWLLERDIAMFAQGWTIELLMYFYRVWHVAPFAFLVFYAGLQSVNQDALESALIDGASRVQRLRYVVLPHLMPLVIFVSLIHLMDAYRVFEEIIGFSASSFVKSFQWITYDYLMPDHMGNRQISSAAASAMLTMIGTLLLLGYPLRKVWKEQKGHQ